MSVIDTSSLYEVGNRKFFVAAKIDTGYSDKEYHEGLMETKLEFSSEMTQVSADDNPSYITLTSPLVGEGTIKFATLPYEIYSKFFNIKKDSNGAITIQSNAKPKFVAFGYYSSVGDGSESMFTLYKAVFETPSLNSVSFDGKTIRDITLKVKIFPHAYTDKLGKIDQVTYTILNSVLNATIWAKAQAKIYIPDSTLT